jgi:hypothetical protein
MNRRSPSKTKQRLVAGFLVALAAALLLAPAPHALAQSGTTTPICAPARDEDRSQGAVAVTALSSGLRAKLLRSSSLDLGLPVVDAPAPLFAQEFPRVGPSDAVLHDVDGHDVC